MPKYGGSFPLWSRVSHRIVWMMISLPHIKSCRMGMCILDFFFKRSTSYLKTNCATKLNLRARKQRKTFQVVEEFKYYYSPNKQMVKPRVNVAFMWQGSGVTINTWLGREAEHRHWQATKQAFPEDKGSSLLALKNRVPSMSNKSKSRWALHFNRRKLRIKW